MKRALEDNNKYIAEFQKANKELSMSNQDNITQIQTLVQDSCMNNMKYDTIQKCFANYINKKEGLNILGLNELLVPRNPQITCQPETTPADNVQKTITDQPTPLEEAENKESNP